jgi:hypothetical protein
MVERNGQSYAYAVSGWIYPDGAVRHVRVKSWRNDVLVDTV